MAENGETRDQPDEPSSPQEIRDRLATELEDYLLTGYSNLLQGGGTDLLRKTLKDLLEALGLGPKAAGGSHQQGLSLSANFDLGTLQELLGGVKTLTGGLKDELSETSETVTPSDAVPWREVEDEQ